MNLKHNLANEYPQDILRNNTSKFSYLEHYYRRVFPYLIYRRENYKEQVFFVIITDVPLLAEDIETSDKKEYS